MDSKKHLPSYLLDKKQVDKEASYIKKMISHGYSKDLLLGIEKHGGNSATFRKKRKRHDQ